jgi:hypothetical protein
MPEERLPQPEEAEGQQRQRLWAKARDELLERQFSNSESYDKAILTLSSAFLALSLTFLKDLHVAGPMQAVWALYLSWITFALAIVSTLVSFRVSDWAISKQLEQLHAYYLEHKEEAYPDRSRARWVESLNAGSGILFVAGVALTVAFVSLNFSEAVGMNKSSGTGREDFAHVPPVAQKVVTPIELRRGHTIPQAPKVVPPQRPASPAQPPAAFPAGNSGGSGSGTTK